MRHWNRPIKLENSLIAKFLPYLWGIETTTSYLHLEGWYPSFLPYLWGIETIPIYSRDIRKGAFLPYLWGIETSHIAILETGQKHSFLPYLWGIETISRKNKFYSHFRFYPTYEALKHATLAIIFWEKTVFTLPMRHWNSSPTLPPENSGLKVFTLPMRHWNSFAPSFSERIKRVFTLPMRHWNRFSPWVYHHPSTFLPYLWGIETL